MHVHGNVVHFLIKDCFKRLHACAAGIALSCYTLSLLWRQTSGTGLTRVPKHLLEPFAYFLSFHATVRKISYRFAMISSASDLWQVEQVFWGVLIPAQVPIEHAHVLCTLNVKCTPTGRRSPQSSCGPWEEMYIHQSAARCCFLISLWRRNSFVNPPCWAVLAMLILRASSFVIQPVLVQAFREWFQGGQCRSPADISDKSSLCAVCICTYSS